MRTKTGENVPHRESALSKKELISFLKSASLTELNDVEASLKRELAARHAAPQQMRHVITYTDGASRGNPGHAGIGALLYDERDEKLLQDFQYIGQCTNNEAEYRALLLALDHAFDITQGEVDCYLDSELTVRQLNGVYEVKSEKLARFNEEVRKRAERFSAVRYHHVPREHPKLRLADQLANRAIDEAEGKKE